MSFHNISSSHSTVCVRCVYDACCYESGKLYSPETMIVCAYNFITWFETWQKFNRLSSSPFLANSRSFLNSLRKKQNHITQTKTKHTQHQDERNDVNGINRKTHQHHPFIHSVIHSNVHFIHFVYYKDIFFL